MYFSPYLKRLKVPNRKHSYPFLTFYFRFCKCNVFREFERLVYLSKTVVGKYCFCKVTVYQLKIALLQINFSSFVMRLKVQNCNIFYAISTKLQSNFIEVKLRHVCSPVNLLHIFKTPFTKNTFGRLLLKLKKLLVVRSLLSFL